jgi:predicted nucleotidyltransferase
MTRLERLISAVFTELTASRQGALVGGLAISARTEPRFTRDVDVAVAVPDDDAAERVVQAFAAAGYRPLAAVEHEAAKRLATVRLTATGEGIEGLVVDLLFASSGIEPEIVAAAESILVLPGLMVSVAQVGHLIALKLLARNDETRPQDAIDLRALKSAATPNDIESARAAVRLIAKRGFARGRDLEAALDALLA